ncbi:MAG TPA: integrase arm-type DNA-binding domain-containing protein [Telluria sp.]
MPFDARAAKLLEPGQHFTITECPGLRIEASTAGHAWIYRYKSPIDSRMRQVKIGAWPATSYNAAVVAWEKLRDVRAAGRDPGDERRAERAAGAAAKAAEREARSRRLTVAKLCDGYLEDHVQRMRKEKGYKETKRLFETMLGELAGLDPNKVTRAQCFDLIMSHAETPVVASNLRRELGAAWDYGLDAGKLDDNTPNWWRLILRGKLKSKGRMVRGLAIGTKKRVLSESELALLIPWLPNFSRLVEDGLTLYLWTLQRGGEILSMHADEISEEADGLWWTIPKDKTKNQRRDQATDVRVPLIGRAERIVRRRLEVCAGGYLFASRGKLGYTEQKTLGAAVWTHMPDCELRPELKRARLPVARWAPHDLRRTGRTMLAAMGCPEEVAEAVIGHMPDGIVGIYNLHRYDKERRHWLAKLNERLEQLACAQQKEAA